MLIVTGARGPPSGSGGSEGTTERVLVQMGQRKQFRAHLWAGLISLYQKSEYNVALSCSSQPLHSHLGLQIGSLDNNSQRLQR